MPDCSAGVLKGLSCRDYEGCAEAAPEAFGLSPSTVSRRFIRASARKLKELCERPPCKGMTSWAWSWTASALRTTGPPLGYWTLG